MHRNAIPAQTWCDGSRGPAPAQITVTGDVYGVMVTLRSRGTVRRIFLSIDEARRLPWVVHSAAMDAARAEAEDIAQGSTA